jgi:type II secretory pathway pseudopilin PulG
MNHEVNTRQSGFTIIELMLAMAFVAALLLAVAMTIVQIGTIYNKGMTLKEVNQTGRVISDDIRRSIASSSVFDRDTSFFTTSTGGRLCTGQMSYVWNYAEAIQNNDPDRITFQDSNDEIRLFKIPDAASAYCARSGTNFVYNEVRPIDQLEGSELLRQGDRTLSIHNVDVIEPVNGDDPLTGQRLYTVSFAIGTGDTTALTDDRTACLPPGNVNANFAFCAVQEFTLVTRAGNRVN